MPAPLSTDLRARVVAAWEAGEGTQPEIAKRFNVGEASLRRWLAKKRKTGELLAKVPDRVGTRLLDAAGETILRGLVRTHPDATEAELVDYLAAEADIVVSRPTVNRCLQRMSLTRKKRPS
jgi:hypothetical protein